MSDISFALTVLTFPSPAILPLQVRVFVPPELLVVQVGVPTKCGLAARTGTVIVDATRVAATIRVDVISSRSREFIQMS